MNINPVWILIALSFACADARRASDAGAGGVGASPSAGQGGMNAGSSGGGSGGSAHAPSGGAGGTPSIDGGALDTTDSGTDAVDSCQRSSTSTWDCSAASLLESPCDVTEIFLDANGQPITTAAADPTPIDQAHCMLRMLHDRTPGRMSLFTEHEPGAGLDDDLVPSAIYTFHMLHDGTAVFSLYRATELGGPASFEHVIPKGDAFFDACLALDFSPELFTCLTQWPSDVAPTACPLCIEPEVMRDCHAGEHVEFALCEGTTSPCAEVFLDLQGQPFAADDPTELPTSSLEDVRCALRALRDRTRGPVRFTTEYSEQPFLPALARTHYTYQAFEDGSIVASRRAWQDLGSMVSWQHRMPKSADYFETCLEHDFGQALFDCFVNWHEQEVPVACPVCE